MKISELINYLEAIKKENGDIDVVCVTPGCGTDFENSELTKDVCGIFKTEDFEKKYCNVKSGTYLYIGING